MGQARVVYHHVDGHGGEHSHPGRSIPAVHRSRPAPHQPRSARLRLAWPWRASCCRAAGCPELHHRDFVRRRRGEPKTFHHPRLGDMTLSYGMLHLGDEGQRMSFTRPRQAAVYPSSRTDHGIGLNARWFVSSAVSSCVRADPLAGRQFVTPRHCLTPRGIRTACWRTGRGGSLAQTARGLARLVRPWRCAGPRSPACRPLDLARTQARRVEITHAPGGSRTISGSTVEPGEAPAGSAGGG